MAGCIIPRTPLAVDYWKRRDIGQARLFFLSHMHSDHTECLSSSWNQKIYCSEITKSLAVEKLNINPSLLIVLPTGQASILPLDEEGIEKLTVTPIDANHCPGAVMFLFEGYFGRILYTGDFRYFNGLLDNPLLNNDIVINKLYLDNTYCDPKCEFPTKAEATLMIMNILWQHTTHDIVFALDTLGKEELLYKVAMVLGVSIVVDHFRLKTTKLMGIDSVFTTDPNASHVRVLPKRNVNTYTVNLWNKSRPTIAIIPTCLYLSLNFPKAYENSDNIFTVPYSDHSSYSELQAFVAGIKPQEIIPIVKKARRDRFNDDDQRTNMSVFAKKKSDSALHLFDIPKSVLSYMSRKGIDVPDMSASKKRRKGSYFGNKAKKACGIVFSPNKKDNSRELNETPISILPDANEMTFHPATEEKGPGRTEEEPETKQVTENNVLENGLTENCVNHMELGRRILYSDKNAAEEQMEDYLKEIGEKEPEIEIITFVQVTQMSTKELKNKEKIESNSKIKERNGIIKEKEAYLTESSGNKKPIQVIDLDNVYTNEFDHEKLRNEKVRRKMEKIENTERKEAVLDEHDQSGFHYEGTLITTSTPKSFNDKEIEKDEKIANHTCWSINHKSKKAVVCNERKKVEEWNGGEGDDVLKENRNGDIGRKQPTGDMASKFPDNLNRLDIAQTFAKEKGVGKPGMNEMKNNAKAGKVNRKKLADKEREDSLNGSADEREWEGEKCNDMINQDRKSEKIKGTKQTQIKLDEIFKKLTPGKETPTGTRINIGNITNKSNSTLNKTRSESDNTHVTKRCAEDVEKNGQDIEQNLTISDETNEVLSMQTNVSQGQILKRKCQRIQKEFERKVAKHTEQINLCSGSLDYNEHSRYCISCIERREAASTVQNNKEIEFAWQVLYKLEAKNQLPNIQEK